MQPCLNSEWIESSATERAATVTWWQRRVEAFWRRVLSRRSPPLDIGRKRPLHYAEIESVVRAVFQKYRTDAQSLELTIAVVSRNGITDDSATDFALDLEAEFGVMLIPRSRWSSLRTLGDVVNEFDKVINSAEK